MQPTAASRHTPRPRQTSGWVRRRVTTRSLQTLAALLAAAVLVSVRTAPAYADAGLVSAEPADGQVLGEPPIEIKLTFTEKVIVMGNQIIVSGPAGPATAGQLEVDGNVARQPLKSDLRAGNYSVAWRIVSADGHPVTGTYGFVVKPPPTGTEATPSPSGRPGTVTPTAASTTANPDPPVPAADDTVPAAPLLVAAGLLAAVAVAIGFWRRRHHDLLAERQD